MTNTDIITILAERHAHNIKVRDIINPEDFSGRMFELGKITEMFGKFHGDVENFMHAVGFTGYKKGQ